jgi:hypothetical protein
MKEREAESGGMSADLAGFVGALSLLLLSLRRSDIGGERG